jgi:hypothetical protein
MMCLLIAKKAGTKHPLRHVIAVGKEFLLFSRVWCLAEIAEAYDKHINQALKVFSMKSLSDNFKNLTDVERIDVNACETHTAEDRHRILRRIQEKYGTLEAFNTILAKLLGAMAFEWMEKTYTEKVAEMLAQTHAESNAGS